MLTKRAITSKSSAAVRRQESADEYGAAQNRGEPPIGAFVFYACAGPVGDEIKNWGHVGLCIGEGKVIHAWDKVRIDHYLDVQNLTPRAGLDASRSSSAGRRSSASLSVIAKTEARGFSGFDRLANCLTAAQPRRELASPTDDRIILVLHELSGGQPCRKLSSSKNRP